MSSLTSSAAYKAISGLDGPVDLRKYTKLKPDVAKCLCCDADLDLSGLKEFTPQLAEAFSRHSGKLILDGLTSINVKTAQAIKENFKGSLHLGNIDFIEDEVLQILSEREAGEGNWKYWPKCIFPKIKKFSDSPGHLAFFEKLVHGAPRYDMHVEELTEKQAEIVARLGDEINYSSLKKLTPQAAEILATSNQKIWLTGIQELSTQTAQAFINHGAELSLGSLDHVSNELALAFSKHKGPIRLGGLKKMPDDQGYIALATKLAEQEKSYFNSYIEEMGEGVAEIFSGCDRINLTTLKTLPDTEGHFKLWEKMCLSAKPEDNLGFYGLEEVPDRFAGVVAKSPAKALLTTLNTWKDEPGHIAYAQRIATNEPPVTNGTIYIKGEFFPNKIAGVLAISENIELQDIKIFDSSEGNIALAKKLANTSKYINIKKISKEVAKVFSEGKNDRLETSNLEEIDPESFKILLAKKNYIFLSNLKKLTEEVALLCQGEKSLGFSSIKNISEGISQLLSNGKGSLNLDGIENFTNESLKFLVKRDGELSLGGITSLSEEQAKILSNARGNLNLNKLKTISDQALSILLELDKTKSINLSSLKQVSEENAERLSLRTGTLNLNGLEELSETRGHALLAEKIATSWRLEQPNLTSIGIEVAKGFAKNSTIKLEKLTELTPEVAKELKNATTLYIPSVNKINMETAQELKDMKGDLTLGNIEEIGDLEFAALCENKTKLTFKAKALSEKKTLTIAKIPNLYIEELEEIPVEIAKCFKGYKGSIYMSSLTTLSPEAAKELRKLRSKLSTTKRGDYALATGL